MTFIERLIVLALCLSKAVTKIYVTFCRMLKNSSYTKGITTKGLFELDKEALYDFYKLFLELQTGDGKQKEEFQISILLFLN